MTTIEIVRSCIIRFMIHLMHVDDDIFIPVMHKLNIIYPRQHFPDAPCVASPSGSERGMSEASNPSFRPRTAESGAERFVPAADQARLRPASPGMRAEIQP